MKIFTDVNYMIVSVNEKPESYDYVFDAESEMQLMTDKWCNICIQKFKYQPSYEMQFNDDGAVKTDEDGNELFKTDAKGNKIQNGYSFYPIVDIEVIKAIQAQYEESQKKEKALTAKLEYLSMMAGVETGESNE